MNRAGRNVAMVLVFSQVSTCISLHIDLPHRRRLPLHHPVPSCQLQLHHFRQSLLLGHSTKDGSGDSFSDDGQKDEIASSPESPTKTFQEGLARGISALPTAIASFGAGSVVTIVLSMISFHQSLYNDQNNYYQKVGVASTVGSVENKKASLDDTPAQQKQRAVELYRAILGELDQRYVDDIEPMAMFEASTRSMLSELDPYTEYIPPQALAKRRPTVGIGAFVMKSGSNPEELLDGKSLSTVLSRIPSAVTMPTQFLSGPQLESQGGFRVVLSLDGYAYDAGLRVGDEILAIDDHGVADDTLESVRGLLMGPPGTKVKVSFKRPGANRPQTIYIERKPVQFPSVPYAGILRNGYTSDDSIGYIRLHHFGLDTGLLMKKAIQSIQPGSLKGLIIDMRDNSGGELLSAVQISSLFFPEGTYLGSSEGKGSLYPDQTYLSGKLDLTQYGYTSSDNRGKIRDNDVSFNEDSMDGKQILDPDSTRVALLVNQKTASASEFLAGVFQDLDKGVIIGSDESSLGKGIGQREMSLPFGGALKLTYHEFYTPSGRCVERRHQGGIAQSGKVFLTKNGRVVHDRRGIEVDYKAVPESSVLSALLSSSGTYYEYADEVYSRFPIEDVNTFFVDDSMYEDFRSFVLREQKSGHLKLEKVFDELANISRLSLESNPKDSRLIQQSVANLREKLE
ncbi:hypothetical protein ACHAWF_018474 [Thalassiosira exigua]